MKTNILDAAQDVISHVDEFFDGVFAPLEDWIPRLNAQLDVVRAGGTLTGAQLAALTEAEAHAILATSQRPIYGAGYCATEDIVSEGNPLAWWQGPDRSLLLSSTFGPGQAAIDLHRLEWFRVPSETLKRHAAGPFVDYLCSNEIAVTSSVPVVNNGTFVGVVCADVLVSSLEEFLLPPIIALGDATLVNAQGRVVVTAGDEFDTGDRFAGISQDGTLSGLGESVSIVRSQNYPFALILPAG